MRRHHSFRISQPHTRAPHGEVHRPRAQSLESDGPGDDDRSRAEDAGELGDAERSIVEHDTPAETAERLAKTFETNRAAVEVGVAFDRRPLERPSDPGGERRLPGRRDFGIEALEQSEARDSLGLDVQRRVREVEASSDKEAALRFGERHAGKLEPPILKIHLCGSHGGNLVGRALEYETRDHGFDLRRFHQVIGRHRDSKIRLAVRGRDQRGLPGRTQPGSEVELFPLEPPSREIVARKNDGRFECHLRVLPFQSHAQLQLFSQNAAGHGGFAQSEAAELDCLAASREACHRLVVRSRELELALEDTSERGPRRSQTLEREPFGLDDTREAAAFEIDLDLTVENGAPANEGKRIETDASLLETEASLPARDIEAVHPSRGELEIGGALEAALATGRGEPAGQGSFDDVGRAEDRRQPGRRPPRQFQIQIEVAFANGPEEREIAAAGEIAAFEAGDEVLERHRVARDEGSRSHLAEFEGFDLQILGDELSLEDQTGHTLPDPACGSPAALKPPILRGEGVLAEEHSLDLPLKRGGGREVGRGEVDRETRRALARISPRERSRKKGRFELELLDLELPASDRGSGSKRKGRRRAGRTVARGCHTPKLERALDLLELVGVEGEVSLSRQPRVHRARRSGSPQEDGPERSPLEVDDQGGAMLGYREGLLKLEPCIAGSKGSPSVAYRKNRAVPEHFTAPVRHGNSGDPSLGNHQRALESSRFRRDREHSAKRRRPLEDVGGSLEAEDRLRQAPRVAVYAHVESRTGASREADLPRALKAAELRGHRCLCAERARSERARSRLPWRLPALGWFLILRIPLS